MARLTKLQTALMEQANACADGALLPVPESFSTTGAALDRAVNGLVKKGYVTQGAATSDDAVDGKVLRLTAAGQEALALVPTATVPAEGETPEAKPTRPGGKLGAVLKAVGRKRGATLAELTEATGWQPPCPWATTRRTRRWWSTSRRPRPCGSSSGSTSPSGRFRPCASVLRPSGSSASEGRTATAGQRVAAPSRRARSIVLHADTGAPRRDADLIAMVADARRWMDDLVECRSASVAEITERERVRPGNVSRILPLAWLAPDIATAILEGRQPTELTARHLRELPDLPLDWAEQRRVLGFPPA